MAQHKRYVQVGVGGRSYMYTEALSGPYRDHSDLVAICDTNPGRLQLCAGYLAQRGVKVKTYLASEFDQMVAEMKPDVVIVTTPCHTHADYICRAMELGVDVISEKAMTVDEQRCQRILDTRQRTGRNCRVTFNYRYAPPATQLKHLLMSGVIGNILSVDFHWLLNTVHGADYFRRWHSRKASSGGLQVHKATHHFDLINWCLSDVPESVYATGGRFFYTPRTAQRYGLLNRSERCQTCPESSHCPFYMDMRQYSEMVLLYLNNEQHDGYFRDQCVFHPEIDIEDTLHAIITYRGGIQMSYSLHAYSPWEGYTVSFTGSKGRIEHTIQETTYLNSDGTIPGQTIPNASRMRIIPHFQPGYDVELWTGEGAHGGGDPLLLEHLFSTNPPADPYFRSADERGGAWSILIGSAINRSMEWGRKVRIDELVHGLAEPDYTPMPSSTEPIDAREIRDRNAQSFPPLF